MHTSLPQAPVHAVWHTLLILVHVTLQNSLNHSDKIFAEINTVVPRDLPKCHPNRRHKEQVQAKVALHWLLDNNPQCSNLVAT